jgi:hypothetical protein
LLIRLGGSKEKRRRSGQRRREREKRREGEKERQRAGEEGFIYFLKLN